MTLHLLNLIFKLQPVQDVFCDANCGWALYSTELTRFFQNQTNKKIWTILTFLQLYSLIQNVFVLFWLKILFYLLFHILRFFTKIVATTSNISIIKGVKKLNFSKIRAIFTLPYTTLLYSEWVFNAYALVADPEHSHRVLVFWIESTNIHVRFTGNHRFSMPLVSQQQSY